MTAEGAGRLEERLTARDGARALQWLLGSPRANRGTRTAAGRAVRESHAPLGRCVVDEGV